MHASLPKSATTFHGLGFVGDMVAENLTPGGKLAGYSEIFRALRQMVSQDGHVLQPHGRRMADTDLAALYAYVTAPVQ